MQNCIKIRILKIDEIDKKTSDIEKKTSDTL